MKAHFGAEMSASERELVEGSVAADREKAGARPEMCGRQPRQDRPGALGVYGPALTALSVELPKPGSVVFDLGADVGHYALQSAVQAGRSGRVCCCGPDVDNLRRPRSNIRLNGSVNATADYTAIGAESADSLHSLGYGHRPIGGNRSKLCCHPEEESL